MKNIFVYRINAVWSATPAEIELGLLQEKFVECTPTQEKSKGWVEPRGQAHGALVEVVNGQLIFKLLIETKSIPSDALNRKVNQLVKKTEAEQGHKLGKKKIGEIKEEIRRSLLPSVLSKRANVMVWIDPRARFLILDCGSQSVADEVITSLVKTFQGFGAKPVNTKTLPPTAMAHWLSTHQAPTGFTVDRECELKAADESKAIVRYSKHSLDTDEVKQHIALGKIPTCLAMTWESSVSFVLTQSWQLKKIEFLHHHSDANEDEFDANLTLQTDELRKLIPDLIIALGGEA